ncbi:MAG: T9SS type A sorting domain-containing protein [Bacteroidales bacterium]|nr:T9SS type A sorting domain-containing protein [Bacteroidales bacterium]
MKKIATLIIITCGIILSIHSQTWVNINSSSPQEIITSVTESNNNTIKVKFETKGFYSEIVRANDLTYHRLSIPRIGRSQNTGLPELPLIRQMIAIPECDDVSIICQTIQETVLNNYNVYPSPDYQVIVNPDSTYVVKEMFSKNPVVYGRNFISPADNLINSELGYLRNQKYIEIEISPFRYNPVTQQLYVATDLEITLNLTNATGSTSSNLGIFNNVAANTMLNYTSTNKTAEENDMRLGGGSVSYIELQTPLQAGNIQADYLIICADQFIENGAPSSELMRIAQHRAYYNGFDVAILKLDNILQVGFSYNDPLYKWEGMMRSCIKAVYDGCNANNTIDGHLGYVLLVGKPPVRNSETQYNPAYHGFVPTAYSHGVKQNFDNYPKELYPSDYWFSCITHNSQNIYDKVGDLFIGRFCVENESQLRNIVNKTIKREREYRPVQSKIVNAANDIVYQEFNGYFENSLYPHIQSFLGNHQTLTIANRWIDNLTTYKTKVLSMLNDGAPYFTIYTHGSYNGWQNLYDLPTNLDNGNTMNQFCMSYACLTGKMDYTLPCWGQKLTSDDPNIGMVGFLGSGRLMPAYNHTPSSFIIGLIPKAIYHDLSHITGEFILESYLNDFISNTRFKLNLFGDPALNIMAKGFEVTNEIVLGGITEISNVITIKNGGKIIIPDNAQVLIGDNAGFNVLSSGSLCIGNNVSIVGINGNNSFIRISGGEFITPTYGNVTFENINIKLSNPSFVDSLTYNFTNIGFSSSFMHATAVLLNITDCDFQESSNVCADHSSVSVYGSTFNKSGLVVSNNSIIGIPIGYSLPPSNVIANGCTFSDCISFEYPTNGTVRAVSNAAIRLQNVSRFELNDNVINNGIDGIYIKNSGYSNKCLLSGNTITECSSNGVIIYNSYANFNKNTITRNYGTGISVFNNSLVTLDDSPGNINEYQLIGYNSSYQIYASENAFPKCNYNKFVGNNNGDYWMYYDSRGTYPSLSTRKFNVKYNNWDGNASFNPNVVFNNPVYFEWLPFWNMNKGRDSSDVEILYEQALQDFYDSLYAKAKTGFLNIVSYYPDNPLAASSLKEIFRLENYLDKNYAGLKHYYLTNENVQGDNVLKKVGDFLSARCDVHDKNYDNALLWYTEQLSNENLNYQDSVFYIIDINDIHLLIDENRNEYELNTDRLLATLPNIIKHADNSVTKQASGEFYSYTGWLTPSYESTRCFAHFTEHGKNVELPYTHNTDSTNVMQIGNIIPDCTPGVVYNHDDKLYRTMDYGQTWAPTNSTTNSMNEYWVFKNEPGTVLERNPDEGMLISQDYGETFEIMDIPSIDLYNVAGWHVGEFFRQAYTDDWELYLTHSLDFNQTADTTYLPQFDNFEMTAGATDGELYIYTRFNDLISYTVFFSSDYGHTFRPLITIDSLTQGPLSWRYWEFAADREPGVFYSITKEASMLIDKGGKIWVDYYRAYGDTLVTTYFHHFTHEWFNHHTPVMDCEIVDCDGTSVTLRWSEPQLKPGEELIGYQVYKGEALISQSLITETEYTDTSSGSEPSQYHIIAVYSDNDVSKSYNIVYCKKYDNVNETLYNTNITVSPNPSTNIVNINGITVAELQVYNARGQLIKTLHNTNAIPVTDFPRGIYLLRITDNQGQIVTRRILVN